MAKEATKTKIEQDLSIKRPSMYNVIYLNDNVTTYEFVIDSLVTVFSYGFDEAMELAKRVDSDGNAVVATMAYELAEHSAVIVQKTARAAGYPLEVRIEEVK